ncbi:MAG: general secretion pathway protein GspK [Pseudomonadales bacterium]|nr:general secretion pathway protein GspK [Pseudomonadales bacterium]MCP5357813.1 general secretion pathway protein GspK [Pseudomonadales bacterium]
MRQQRGSVIIIVLWTTILLTILVTVMAGKVQLSARTAFHNREAATDLARIDSAMNQAEMELILETMQRPIDYIPETDEDGNYREPRNRFNGQPLSLYYPAGDDMVVRIYDHTGKINLNNLRANEMRLLIEKRLGPDADRQQVNELVEAWSDWTDLNDQPGINGAERDYYESLDPPYSPRNNSELDSVEELRLIRGYDELFKDVNLDAAFTIYGSTQTVNLNFATREAMQLLPGLNDELIEEIIAYRERKDFRNKPDVGSILPVENFAELSPWIGNNTSSYYSVFAYPKANSASAESAEQESSEEERPDPVTQAYMQIMEVSSPERRARVYKVDPYGRLPDTAPAHPEE